MTFGRHPNEANRWATRTSLTESSGSSQVVDDWFFGVESTAAPIFPALTPVETDDYVVVLVGKAGVGGRLLELPTARVTSVTWELNGDHAANITMPTSDPLTKQIKLIETEVQIWRKGVLLWWGVPWRMHADVHNHFFNCFGLWSYFKHRFIENDLSYTGVDQLTIAWNVLNYTQTTHGSFGITSATFAPSGVLRDRTYNSDEHRKISEIVEDFANIQGGFDFDIKVFGDGRREWTPYYPSKGTLKSSNVMEWGKNIVDYRYKSDGQRLVTKAIFTGSGEGPEKPEGFYYDAAAAAQYHYLAAIYSDSDVTEVTTLNSKAEALVRARNRPIKIPDITISGTEITEIEVGDRVPVRIDHGATFIDGTYRIVRMSLDPPTETIAIEFNEEAA